MKFSVYFWAHQDPLRALFGVTSLIFDNSKIPLEISTDKHIMDEKIISVRNELIHELYKGQGDE